jgi:hypothetical protein
MCWLLGVAMRGVRLLIGLTRSVCFSDKCCKNVALMTLDWS